MAEFDIKPEAKPKREKPEKLKREKPKREKTPVIDIKPKKKKYYSISQRTNAQLFLFGTHGRRHEYDGEPCGISGYER